MLFLRLCRSLPARLTRTSDCVQLRAMPGTQRLPLSPRHLRLNSTLPPVRPVSTEKRHAYPEKLLIYHAGTARTVFVGCLKVTTIFIVGFFSLIVAPAHFYAPEEPAWLPPLVLISGFVPFLFVSRASAPFVNYVHLRLPPFARHSREFVHRYSMTLPPTATLYITTMNIIGKPRVSKVALSELHALEKAKLIGGTNYVRAVGPGAGRRKWWMPRAVTEFAIKGGEGNSREKGVWENVAKAILKNEKQ